MIVRFANINDGIGAKTRETHKEGKHELSTGSGATPADVTSSNVSFMLVALNVPFALVCQ